MKECIEAHGIRVAFVHMPTVPVLIILSCLLFTSTNAQCVQLSIEGRERLFTTEPFFASWNIDSSRQRNFFDIDFSDSRLRYLASQIGGAVIRFGGTGNDFLHYVVGPDAPPCATVPFVYECLNTTWWENLYGLSAASSSALVFGLNITQQPWDAYNAVSLLEYAKSRNQTFFGLELGNEQNSKGMSAEAQADSLRVLSEALDKVYGQVGRPVLLGPDPSGFHVAPKEDASGRAQRIVEFLKNFTIAAAPYLYAITHHEYIEIDDVQCINSTWLDSSREIAKAVVAAVRESDPAGRLKVFAGEIGPHNGGNKVPNCEGNKVCGRWGSSLWYMDSMGAKSREGYGAFFRQDFIGADYGLLNYTSFSPSTDFWVLMVWRRTVGTGVLNVSKAPMSAHGVRVYAFCGVKVGTVTLVLLNLNATVAACSEPPALANSNPRQQFTLTPSDGTVTSAGALLNGQLLQLGADGRVPSLLPQSLPATAPIALPPLSITFAVFSSEADACL